MKRISTSIVVLTVLLLFTGVDFAGAPVALNAQSESELVNQTLDAAGQPAYTGTGAARTATLKGLVTNTSAGPLVIDSATTGYAKMTVPSGWTGTYVRSDINSMSMWSSDALNNGKLDAYHSELWLGMSYDSEEVIQPDSWTLVKSEYGIGSGRALHPHHGIFEMNDWGTGTGYGDSSAMGWEFEAIWSSANVLTANDKIYLSQQVEVPRRAIYSATVNFMYNVISGSSLLNQTYVFARIGSTMVKMFVFEASDAVDTWLQGSANIPASAFLTTSVPCQVTLDVGLATDLSGAQANARTSEVLLDDIEFLLQVRPFPEQITLKANGTTVTGSSSGSVSPYVPDSASRDCYDDISTGVDLNGYADDGILDVGIWDSSAFNVASTYQVGLQFPLSIPKGAGITSAYLEVESAGTSNTPNMRIYLADADTVSAFTAGLPHLEARYTWMSTSIDWNPTGWVADTRYASPDISGPIQKVVTRAGWSSGNYICIMLNFTYSTSYQCYNAIKGTTGYDGAHLARVFVNYVTPAALPEKYTASGSWAGPRTLSVGYSTTSASAVTLDTAASANVTTTLSTLDNSYNVGTTFSVSNGSVVTWTANVLISPPAGVGYTNVSLSKPSSWTLSSVTDADGSTRTSEVTTTSSEVRAKSSVVDVFGIWKFVLTAVKTTSGLQCGINAGGYSSTYTYYVGNAACFRGGAAITSNSAERLLLTNPSGQIFYATDDLSQDGSGYFEWTGVTVTSSWAAGVWYADVNFNNTKGAVPAIVGRDSASFTVIHATGLSLISPSTQTSSKIVGNLLYVQVKLTDTDNSALMSGATVTMNWTNPSTITLDDMGNGYYEKTMNTTDLGTAKRWRINFAASKQYYTGSSTYMNLDLSHSTFLTYSTPASAPYGDNFVVKVTLYDAFSLAKISGATISSNRTIVGTTDHGNGSYTVTLQGGLSVGDYVYFIKATPSSTYLLAGNVSIKFTVRNIYTTTYGIGGSSASTPYSISTSKIITYNDTDHSFAGIAGASNSVQNPSGIVATVSDSGSGKYTVSINVGTKAVGTYLINITLSKSNYYSSIIRISLTIVPRTTSVVSKYTTPVPWGFNSGFTVTWYDVDGGGANISASGYISSITVNGTSYGSSYMFAYLSSGLTVKSYNLNVTVNSNNANYKNSWQIVTLVVRAHFTTISAVVANSTAWGFNTLVTVTFRDTDTGSAVPIANVSTIQYTPTGYGTQTPANSYTPTLTTNTWTVGSVSTTVTATCVTSNKFYSSASSSFTITIRPHHTTVSAVTSSSTPWGSNTPITVAFRDTDTGSAVPIANVSSIQYTPTGYGTQTPANSYSPTLTTSTWTIGSVSTGVSVTCVTSNKYYDSATSSFVITIRAHHTMLSASVAAPTPWGYNTAVSVVFWDTDSAVQVPLANVSSIQYTPTGYGTQTPANSYTPTLTTNTWTVGSVSTGVSATCITSNKYYDAASSTFSIQIRAHRTSLSVSGGMLSPYGNYTRVTVVFTDLDNAAQVPIGNVTTNGVSYNAGALGTQTFTNYTHRLDTRTWSVGAHSITLTVTCVQTNKFYDTASYTFSITIVSLGTYLYNEPNDLVFPSGDSFSIILRFNVSEPGNQYNGNPINGITAAEFTVKNSTYTFPKTVTALGNGRYNLTISSAYLNMNSYTITITITPSNQNYGTASLVISFSYRPARSYLSSANYPHVTTPYGFDIAVSLNYTDVDRNKGITTASITAQGITIYSIQNLGSGIYQVVLNVTGLAKGDHLFNLSASAAQYETKKLTFTLTIRIAYTSAIPTVGSLDIPVGNNPVFYVTFWDTDRNQPITGASMTSNWTHTLTATYVPADQRYSVTFLTFDTDPLKPKWVVVFNFSKGGNYQFGVFSISVTIRTHNTDFRLVSAVQPTSYNGIINMSLYYGDLDNNVGISSASVAQKVRNATGLVTSSLVNSGGGFYIVRVSASQFRSLGLQTLTVYFNWTGSVYKYFNMTLVTGANIVGEDSKYTLLQSAEPTAYLGNMSYTFLYAELYSSLGITNATGNVHIRVIFQGETVNLSKVKIWETNRGTSPGYYSIRFNTTLFTHTGLIYMNVYINWSKGVSPFYTNRTDTISVRILPRDTLVSVIPPTPTSWGQNATFSFYFEDVTGGNSTYIANDAKLSIKLSLSSFTLSYNAVSRMFTVSFNTTQSPIGNSPLGLKSFTLNVTWAGAPYYANRTGQSITVTTLARLTVLDYQTPAPTSYLDNVTFVVTWTDVTGTSRGINGATVTLYDGVTPISASKYKVTAVGGGSYSIQLNTTYKSSPGIYILRVVLTRPEFYMPIANSTKQFNIMQRVTLLSSEPIDQVAYNSSIQVKVHYQDLLRLTSIGNGSGLTSIRILNGTSWLFTCSWQPAFGYYFLTVSTYNHAGLKLGTVYTLHINMTYANQVPFYAWDDAYITFQLRSRVTSLSASSPSSTPYLDYANFTLTYLDVDGGSKGISSATISIKKGGVPLTLGSQYLAVQMSAGVWAISINTTALNGITTTTLDAYATWFGTPYYANNSRSVDIGVIRRPTTVDLVTPPSLTRYLNNVVFTIAYSDVERRYYIAGVSGSVLILNGTKYLTSGQYSIAAGSVAGTYDITINSTILSSHLLTNYQIALTVYWLNVSPYYANATATVRITTTNRVGALTWIPIDNTPVGDLLNLTFYYKDLDTGAGIANAIVQFDCEQKPGLVAGTDYILVKGTGADIGTYYIRVNTNRLLGNRSYTFTLTVLWNAANVPYYTNQTPRSIGGVVRLILDQLTTYAPTPSTVPYYDNVSVDVTFYDSDHKVFITTVTKSNVTVVYGSGSQPKVWGFTNLGGGSYRITVNISDSGAYGSKTLRITFNRYPYVAQQQDVNFYVRLRNGLAAASAPTGLYARDPGFFIVNITDDDSAKPLSGATLAVTWGPAKSWVYIGSGRYNVSFSTTGMPAGSTSMQIQASKANYTFLVLIVNIYLQAIPISIVIPNDLKAGPSVFWGDSIVIHVLINDTLHRVLVSNVTVTYVFGTHSGSLAPTSPSGNYSVSLDTSLVSWGSVTVSLRAVMNNYAVADAQISINVQMLPTSVTPDALSITLARGSPWTITVYLNDTYNNVPVTDAVVSISWRFDVALTDYMTSNGDGHYEYSLGTASAAVGYLYTITMVATRPNHQTASTSVQLFVTQVTTYATPDSGTATYVNKTFYWSQRVRIGVWVTAGLPPSDPGYYRSDAYVRWQAGEKSGSFTLNGSAPGHYYYWLNTSELSATSYTFWITAHSIDPQFADSGTVVTVVIQRIPTSVIAPTSQEKYWGWNGSFDFRYLISDTSIGIANVSFGHVVNASYLWFDGHHSAKYLGNGTYSIFIDTSLVEPGTYPMTLSFYYDNYVPSSGSFYLIVSKIPTAIKVDYQNGVYDPDKKLYEVAYGDDFSLLFFFNATVWPQNTSFWGGIDGASYDAWLYPGYTSGTNETLARILGGYYRLTLRTTDFRIQADAYRFSLTLSIDNRRDAHIDLLIKIIPVPTAFTFDGLPGDAFSMFYGETKTFTIHYYDNWSLHGGQGIEDANITIHASSGLVTTTTDLGGGTYQLTIFADPGLIPIGLQESRLYVDITLSKVNFSNGFKSITVTALPTDTQRFMTTAVTFAAPAFFIIMTLFVLWLRVFSVPKRLREINGLIKSIRKGKMPKPITGVKSRQELVADLYNDTFVELKLVKTAVQVPSEAVVVEIPEMGELLIELSMLTHLSPQELDDFKADISKMKISEQAAFVKEVINQEALRTARRESKTLDQVMAELKAQAEKRMGEAQGEKAGLEVVEEVPEEGIILLPERPKAPAPSVEGFRRAPPAAGAEEIVTGEKLSQYELEELKKQLEQKGVPAHEIDTIMEQAKKLPKYLIDELVKSLTREK